MFRILIREFGSQNSTVYSVPKPELRENRSVYSIQENLEHGVGYSVCIQDLRYGNQYPDTPGDCAEVRTEPGGFSVGEVATATAVSSTTTLAVVFLGKYKQEVLGNILKGEGEEKIRMGWG